MVLQVIIRAGGRGGCLYPLITHIPKTLLPICNKPLIIYVLEMLERSECKFALPILLLTQQDYQKKLEKCLETKYKLMSENSFQVIGVPEEYPGTLGSLRYILSSPYIHKGNNELLILSGDLLLDFSVLPAYLTNFRINKSGCSLLARTGKSSNEEMQIFALSKDQIVQIFD